MVEVYVDGASAGDPGLSGCGIFMKNEHGQVEEFAYPLPAMSNHEAEFVALTKALEICRDKNVSVVSFRTDSELIEKAIEKRYVKNTTYADYLQRSLEIIDQFDLFFIKWIPSKENKADRLARQAIKSQK